MKRREARLKAIQALYQIDMTDCDPEYAISCVLDDHEPDDFLADVVHGTIREQDAIDNDIRNALTNWTIDRLSIVDRSILRLAVYELTFSQESPQAVVINEAVQLGKTFGNEENGKFINGVLSRIVQS